MCTNRNRLRARTGTAYAHGREPLTRTDRNRLRARTATAYGHGLELLMRTDRNRLCARTGTACAIGPKPLVRTDGNARTATACAHGPQPPAMGRSPGGPRCHRRRRRRAAAATGAVAGVLGPPGPRPVACYYGVAWPAINAPAQPGFEFFFCLQGILKGLDPLGSPLA